MIKKTENGETNPWYYMHQPLLLCFYGRKTYCQ